MLEWYEVAGRLAAAAALGGAIGFEREAVGHDAGFRTHMLLALGAALFGAISVGAFDTYTDRRAATNVNIDITRIASYVAAGVGFIGGGAILKSFGAVRGITTATSLWTAAAVGLAAGLGFWAGAVVTTVVALIALAALKPIDTLIDRYSSKPYIVLVQTQRDADLGGILEELRVVVGSAFKQIRIGAGEDDIAFEVAVELFAKPDDTLARRLRERLAVRDDVVAIRLETSASIAAEPAASHPNGATSDDDQDD